MAKKLIVQVDGYGIIIAR